MLHTSIPDSSESNAGDDFHILWTIYKSLKLINFEDNGLKGIAVENLSSDDASYIDTSGGMSLGVDLTEYYGGKTFAEANQVVVSQLKYSTRNPDKEWTPAQICKSRKNTHEGSIVHRLATFFDKLSEQLDRGVVQDKLKIKLVSNRPAASKLVSLVIKVKDYWQSVWPRAVDILEVETILGEKEKRELRRLFTASQLSGSNFIDFVNVLDFSDCGVYSRFELEKRNTAAIASYSSLRTSLEYSYLYKLISGTMMPEQKANNTIRLSDVLYAFSLHDISALFPVKNEIEKPDIQIPREQLAEIRSEVLNEECTVLCLHGGAGIGKSTLVNMLPETFPENSVAIVFDCYGGGSYLDPDDRRHKHAEGIMQLCNELSIKVGSNLLMNPSGSDEFFLKQFKARISQAIKIIQSNNPSAVLAIILDAADNSVTAAKETNGHSFVKDLLQMQFPTGCKIIVSSRTERLETLNLPSRAKSISLTPFSYNETAQLLNGYFDQVESDEIEEFRKLTHSIPRVMAYALELQGKTLSEKMISLKPGGKTLDQIFHLRIDQAARKSSKNDVEQFLTYLIVLPRPVPLKIVQAITGLSEGILQDIHIDLWREILQSGRHFTFRDEDFETFLRLNFIADRKDYDNIASTLLAYADEDEYASTHLGHFLSKAERHAELREIVIDKRYLSYPLDPVKNKEVFIERTRYAMVHSDEDFNAINFFKLLIISAESAKTNDVLENLLLGQPELAAEYGNRQTNEKLYFQSGNPAWFGPIHYRNAAFYARNPQTRGVANEHLKKARDWLDYRARLDETEIEDYKISTTDIANGAEAIFYLSNIEDAIEWISGWGPQEVVYRALKIFLHKLIYFGQVEEVNIWLKTYGNNLRIDIRLLIVRAYFFNDLDVPLDIDKMLRDIMLLKNLKNRQKQWGGLMAFCEYCLSNGIEYGEVKPVLSMINPKAPIHAPGFYDNGYGQKDRTHIDLLLRKGIILHFFENTSFADTDFYAQSLQDQYTSNDYATRSKVEDQVKRFQRIYAHLLPGYHLRASYFFRRNSSENVKIQMEGILDKIEKDWELRHYHRLDYAGLRKFIVQKVLDIVFHASDESLVVLIKEYATNEKITDIDLLLSVCNKLSKQKRFRDSIEYLLGITEGLIDSARLSGREIVEFYTRAAIIGARCISETGKYYFDKIVHASNEIDLETHDELRSIRDFTDRINPLNNSELAIKFFRYAEYCSIKLKGWDGFPWYVLVQILTKLDIRTAFAVICQWDHRYIKSTDEHYMELITSALEQDFITPDIGVAMLVMNKYYYDGLLRYYKILFEKIDEKRDRGLKNEALTQIIHDIKLHRPSTKNTNFLRDFFDLIKDGRFTDKSIIQGFEEYIIELENIIDRSPKENGLIEDRPHANRSYIEVIKRYQDVDDQVIKKIVSDIRSDEGEASYVDFPRLFAEIAANVKRQHYTVFLDATVRIGDLGACYNDFEIGLKTLVNAWKKNSQVKEWMASAFEEIRKAWSSILFDRSYFSFDVLKRLASILEIGEEDLAKNLVKVIPENLHEHSSNALYQMLTVIYPLIPTDKNTEVLDWILSRREERVPEDFAVINESDLLANESSMDVVANFLRYNLGHPEKSIRWSTGHILRRLNKLGNNEILIKLLDLQNEVSCHPFQDAGYTFYWISAKLYLWISIARISWETPKAILPLSGHILAEIRNNDLPHAQIKFFAKLVAHNIIKSHESAFSLEERKEIDSLFNSPFETHSRTNTKKRSSKRGTRQDLKFKFNTLDTLPYWYEPLGRIFNVGQTVVAELADKYISEYWGYVGDVLKDNHIRDSDYTDTSHSHGSEPRIENLQTYYEYHAMFCAAFELLQTKPLILDEEGWRETFHEWLEGWGTYWKNFWLSDFNEPTPLSTRLWVNNREGNREWEWDIHDQDFKGVLGLANMNTLVVYMGATTYYGKDYEEVSVRSGLVDPVTGGALLRLFQSRSSYDNHVPMEKETDYDDYDERSFKDSFPQFKLAGWLYEEKTDIDGLDDLDPLYKNLSKSRIRPGSLFCEWSDCTFSEDFKFSFRDDDGIDEWITRFFSWSDVKERESYNDFTTNGVMLLAKRKELKSFLNFVGKDLMVQVKIGRKVKREDYNYYPPYCKIYLLKANGRIETFTGDNLTW